MDGQGPNLEWCELMESPTTPEIHFRLPVAVKPDEATPDQFVSYCAPLDLYAAGKSEEEAFAAIKSAILMLLKHCFQRRILDDYLTDHGFFVQPPTARGSLSGARPQWFIALNEFGGKHRGVDVKMPLGSLSPMAAAGDQCQLA